MANFVFGRTLDYLFSPLSADTQVPVDSLVSARIYENAPTNDQLDNTESPSTAIEEVTSWIDNGDNTYTISFSSVVDSDPYDAAPYENYYVVVNFKYTTGASAVFDDTMIRIYRPNSWAERISVTYEDIENIENKLSECFFSPIATLTAHIADAKEHVLHFFEGQGYDKAKLIGLDKLNLAVKYKATEMACRNASSEEGQFWFDKADYYALSYQEILEKTKIEQGEDTENSQPMNTNSILMLR